MPTLTIDGIEVEVEQGTTVLAFQRFENRSGVEKYGDVGESLITGVISSLLSDPDFSEFVEIVRRDGRNVPRT